MFKFTYYKQCCLLLCFILWSAFGLPTYTSSLDRDEEKTLRQIANTTGLDQNTEAYSSLFAGDPCKVHPYYFAERGNLTVKCNQCNNNVCRITELYMKDLSLPGMLPKELVNLKYLEKIDFTRNCLEGLIPKQWAVMTHLNYISLQANRLSGEIPKEWRNFPNLTYLSLEANNLSGEVPEDLGKLANLTRLILSSNKFVGTLPKTLGEVKNLSDLRISDNSFNGTIPEFIGSLSQLKRLEMQATGMEGPVNNQTFRGLEQLEDLRISDINGTESTFPTLSSKNIKNLVLRHMNLSGTIPETIWNMEHLKMLDVSFNNLEGELPAKELPALKYRFVGGNKLNGNVPKKFLSFKVKSVDISYNNFTWSTGCDKDSMDNVNSYRSSALTKNDGRLLPCSNIPNCQQSRRSSLHINCGGQDVTITNANGSLLYEGDISGTPKLNYNGPHWGFSSTGDFMDDDEREEYVVDNKEYSSEKLEPIYKTIRKSPMSLMYYGCLKNGNYTIKLHFPDITSRAKGYNKLARHFFDIYIQEKLMRKDFSIEVEANKTGNKGVVEQSFNVNVTENRLEIRFYWAGKGTTCIPQRGNYGILISAISVCPSSKSHCEEPRKTSRKPIVIGAITSVLCLLFFVVGVIAWRTYRKTTRERDLTGLELITGSFTLRQLRAATNNFDSANKIGEGGFGSVYKGELADGTAIAVKKLSSKSRQGNREFVTEIGIISGLQHPNLVKFYGCCIDGNHLLLVYEYMENNCLARALFGSSKAEERSLKLDWAVRVKICVGIANGLAFLHEGSALKIVHRDIKATNVLLDRDLNAKISDFGLAKLHEEDESHISTRIAGTIGYMAPEYALWGFLTEKADVYSFGVVALEIVSGKNNTSYRPQNDCVCLLDYAFVLQKRKNLLEIVDPNLGDEFNKKEAEKIIKVALLCTNASAALRPTMSEVVSFLEGEGTLVEEVISDPGIYGDDLESDVRFKSLRNYYQQIQKKNNEENKDQAEPSSSATSAHDLYQINFESITISSKDLYPINPDSTSKSELSSLISRHSS